MSDEISDGERELREAGLRVAELAHEHMPDLPKKSIYLERCLTVALNGFHEHYGAVDNRTLEIGTLLFLNTLFAIARTHPSGNHENLMRARFVAFIVEGPRGHLGAFEHAPNIHDRYGGKPKKS